MRILFLITFVLLGCTQPLAPSDVAGRYAQERVNGQALPIAMLGPADEPLRLLGHQIVLLPDGRAETVIRVEELWGPGAPRIVETREAWVFRIDGARVLLRSPPCASTFCSAVLRTMDLRILGDALLRTDGELFHRTDAIAP